MSTNNENSMQVSNEMLYELIKDMKAEMVGMKVEMASMKAELKAEIADFKADVNRRFNEVDRRFDEVDKKFEDVYRNLWEVRDMIKEERRERQKQFDCLDGKLDDLKDFKEKSTVRFTRKWVAASFGIAILSSTVALVFDKVISF